MKEDLIHVFIDTETTGLGHADWHEEREDAIVEIGIAIRIDGELYSRSWLCNPGEKYFENGRADYALSVSHIPINAIMNAARDTEVALKVKGFLADLLHPLTNRPIPLFHSYNIAFDRPFLEKSPWNFEYKWGEDPMIMARDILNGKEGKYPKLDDAMHSFGISRKGNAHRAESDAIAALEVFEACKEYLEKEGEQ